MTDYNSSAEYNSSAKYNISFHRSVSTIKFAAFNDFPYVIEEKIEIENFPIREKLKIFGFDVYLVTNRGDTALHQAVRKQNLEAVELLIEFGFNPNLQNKSGDSALHIAAEKGNLELLEFLVLNNADIYLKNQLDQTPYHKAFKNNYSEILRYFESQGYEKDDEFSDYIISQGLQPNLIDNAGNTFMHRLVKSKNIALVKEILKTGYKIEQIDQYNKSYDSPFTVAIKQKDEDMVLLFIANFQTKFIHNRELAIAAQIGWKRGLEILLDQCPQFDVDYIFTLEEGSLSLNLMHYAAFSGDFSTIKLLVERGASLNASTKSAYQQGIDERMYWTRDDWEADAELNNFNFPPRIIREGGHIHPIMNPLSIVEHFHPDKKDLQEYLIGLGAKSEYTSSLKYELPEKMFSKLPY